MRVSCVLPVHNGARFLREAVESVLAQDHDDLEIIVVNDGSTDGTADVLAAFAGRLIVLNQDRRGPSAARNRGVDLASGPLLAFIDADDLWLPEKLERQVACFDGRPTLDMCRGLVQNFWMEELAEEEAAFRNHPFARPLPGYHLGAILVTRTCFDRVGPFDEHLAVAEDNEWFLRAREREVVEFSLPEVVLRRRLHQGNLTRSDLASRDALLSNLKAALDRRRVTS